MGILDTIQRSFKESSDKKKEQKELVERLKREAKVTEQIEFEKAFKENALEVAKARAKKDASELSGLRKLRATNRARNLSHPQSSGSFFSKMSEHTQKNLARRDENLKKTEEMRETAKKMREEKLATNQAQRQERLNQRKSFGKSYI